MGDTRIPFAVGLVAAVVMTVIFGTAYAGQDGTDASVDVATQESIAEHAAGQPVVSEFALDETQAGYYQVRMRDDAVLPAYWVPPSTASDAPPAIQSTPAVQSSLKTGTTGRGEIVFAPGASIVLAADKVSGRQGAKAGHGGKKGGHDGPTASASNHNDCPQAWFCFWRNDGWGGDMAKWTDEGIWQNLGDFGFNNDAESYYNRRDHYAVYSKFLDGNGDLICVVGHGVEESMQPSQYRNDVSSLKLRNGFSC